MQIPNKLSLDSKVSGREMKRSFNMLIDAVKSNRIVTDNRTLQLTRTGSGTSLKAIREEKTGGNLTGGGAAYDGAFKVIQDPDNANKVLIKGYSEVEGEERAIHNYVVAGLSRIENEGDTAVTITSTGIVYAHIWYDSGYLVEYLFADELPAQTAGHFYKTLANVEFAESAVTSIIQIIHDELFVMGRLS